MRSTCPEAPEWQWRRPGGVPVGSGGGGSGGTGSGGCRGCAWAATAPRRASAGLDATTCSALVASLVHRYTFRRSAGTVVSRTRWGGSERRRRQLDASRATAAGDACPANMSEAICRPAAERASSARLDSVNARNVAQTGRGGAREWQTHLRFSARDESGVRRPAVDGPSTYLFLTGRAITDDGGPPLPGASAYQAHHGRTPKSSSTRRVTLALRGASPTWAVSFRRPNGDPRGLHRRSHREFSKNQRQTTPHEASSADPRHQQLARTLPIRRRSRSRRPPIRKNFASTSQSAPTPPSSIASFEAGPNPTFFSMGRADRYRDEIFFSAAVAAHFDERAFARPDRARGLQNSPMAEP